MGHKGAYRYLDGKPFGDRCLGDVDIARLGQHLVNNSVHPLSLIEKTGTELTQSLQEPGISLDVRWLVRFGTAALGGSSSGLALAHHQHVLLGSGVGAAGPLPLGCH